MAEVWVVTRTLVGNGWSSTVPMKICDSEGAAKNARTELDAVISDMLQMAIVKPVQNGGAEMVTSVMNFAAGLGISKVEHGYVKTEVQSDILVPKPNLVVV